MQATMNGVNNIYLFIAELNGAKNLSVSQKREFGRMCYVHQTLPHADLGTEEGRSELHEVIWLERLYADLDNAFAVFQDPMARMLATDLEQLVPYEWTVPIELDASASMLSYIGCLLGDKRLLQATNTYHVEGESLNDPWAYPGIPRKQFKTAATPMLYGSGKSATELWKKAKLDFTLEQVVAYNEVLASGSLGVANDFKDLVIGFCKPKETMQVNIFNELFEIRCNRYHNTGEKMVAYDIYNSSTDTVERIHHMHTIRTPDLKGFRTYFQTLLIHNLDSQVANRVMSKLMSKYNWGLDIHDAFIVNPESADDVRMWYAEEIQAIFDNRQSIIQNYFRSIGIGAEAGQAWANLKAKVHHVGDDFKASPWALK